jgi:hypothetical protein
MNPIPPTPFPKPQKILVEKKFLGDEDKEALGSDPSSHKPASEDTAAAEERHSAPVSPDDPRYGYSPLHPGAGGGAPTPAVDGGRTPDMKPLIDPAALQAPAEPAGAFNRPKAETGVH